MRKAVIVGIDNYTSAPLSGCCNDAKAMARILEQNEDGTVNFSVKLVTNVSTKAELYESVKLCFDGDDEVALFYFSGHGAMDSTGVYLVTPDYTSGSWGISLQDVLSIANKSKCRHKIVILDSCHSGFMGAASASTQNTAVINEGVTILTASRNFQSSLEINGHGLFTSLILDALNGGAADITGNITPGSIYSYVDKALGPFDQRPVFKTNVTQFVSLRQVKPRVDIAVIHNICELFPNPNAVFNLDPSFEPTNHPSRTQEAIEPYAVAEHEHIFADLQKLEGIGIVAPVGADHMYYAAMEAKGCILTSVGKYYWQLVNNKTI